MNKHEVEYNGEKYELNDEQYEELKSAIELIEKAGNSKFSDVLCDVIKELGFLIRKKII